MTASDNSEASDKQVRISRPVVSLINSISLMSNMERKLIKLFKCCFYSERCFFTTDDADCFLKHLNTRHKSKKVFCIYCYYQSGGTTEQYAKTDRLIDHIITDHGLRIFQCNLCVYRGSSINHVLLHQANIHGNNYQTTLSGDGSICKVLVCKQIAYGPLPNETVYWYNYHAERIVDPPKNPVPKYQCIYCDFISLVAHVVFFHICKVHPDYSLSLLDKYVDQLPEIEETDEKNGVQGDEDAELDAIIHDLHSIGTKDDDGMDMTSFDDAPPEDFSNDEEAQNQANNNTFDTIPTRERLFGLKGVRIAKKQSEPVKTSKARKHTAKPPEIPEFDKEEEEEEEVPLTARQRIMRGYRPEQDAALFKPMPLGGNKISLAKQFSDRNMFKCLLCADGVKINRVGIESHLVHKHNTTSSYKCVECSFVGPRNDIIVHFKSAHGTGDTAVKVTRFIVALDEEEEASQPLQSVPVRVGGTSDLPKSKKRTQEKDPKNLSSKIKRSVFIGPKCWKDKRKQERKEKTGEDSDESEIEENLPDELETMEVDDDDDDAVAVNQESSEGTSENGKGLERANRFVNRSKRKASELDEEPEAPVEELLERKSVKERDSEYFFCLFCSDYNTKDFSQALFHMKWHLRLNSLTCSKCFNYQCESIEVLKNHHLHAHPTDIIPLPNANANNTHINYITEFLNEQFLRRRKGDQMSNEQATRYARIICPICERANKITNDKDYHFTKWRPFKTHFWKHSNATFIECRKCRSLVPRTRKRSHLKEKHKKDFTGDVWDIRDFSPFYHEPLSDDALCALKSAKRRCKALYMNRIKEEFEIGDCQVNLTRIKLPETVPENIRIKEEPLET